MDDSFDPTQIAAGAILGDPLLFNEFVFELIGPSDNRVVSDDDAAKRFELLTSELAQGELLRRHAPALQALWLLGPHQEVDWSDVVRVIGRAAGPRRNSRIAAITRYTPETQGCGRAGPSTRTR